MKTLPGGSANVSLFRRGNSDYKPAGAYVFFREILNPYRKSLVFVFSLTILTVVSQTGALLLVRPLLDKVVLPHNLNSLPLWGGAMFLLLSITALTQWGVGNRVGYLGSRLADVLRLRLFRHAMRLPVGFYDIFPSGEITSRVMQDTIAIERFIIERLPYAVVNLLVLIGAGAALFWIDPVLGLLACIPLPIFALSAKWFHIKQHADLKSYFSLNSQLNSTIHESVSGIKAIKAACRESQIIKKFEAMSKQSQKVEFSINHLNVMYSEAGDWVLAVGVAVLWYAGALMVGDDLSAGSLVAATAVARFFYAPLKSAAGFIHQCAGAVAAAGRIQEFLDVSREKAEGITTGDAGEDVKKDAEKVRGLIEYSGVHFSYIPGTEVIHNLGFKAEPGEMIGLVGRSGAGKSTLINLLCRFYLPDSGKLLVDGRDVAEYQLEFYRGQIGLVLQEPFLFRMSIEDNIRFARPAATREEVINAASLAQAHGFIEKMKNGYDSVIGDEGVRLSVGESQRIAIARAILQDPAILILDEATSNLDAETEVLIQRALQELVRGRTTIAIAHRLSTLRNASRLIVIDDGKIVEEGTHEELVGMENGLYAGLVKAQSREHHLHEQQDVWKME